MLGYLGGEGPCSCLDGNQRQTQAAKVREVLFAEKRKERHMRGMQQDLETMVLQVQLDIGFYSILLPVGGCVSV
jgi:hypothetical protein